MTDTRSVRRAETEAPQAMRCRLNRVAGLVMIAVNIGALLLPIALVAVTVCVFLRAVDRTAARGIPRDAAILTHVEKSESQPQPSR